ncbi:MAG: DEAD/DEAH box helicase, partial [Alphaproteobacteria bacterium]|nr:DEAD/DEAH box helicase [Alphaproteobacteria bacterium]
MQSTFETLGLGPDILRALEQRGYRDPTPIQQKAIPAVLAGNDVVGSAQTGTGKTAAFLLPILQRLAAGRRGKLRALVLVPTRELAQQVLRNAEAYGRHLDLTSTAIYGGVGMEPQTRALARGVDVVIATPGRLIDHIERGHVASDALEVLVLDEADRMLDMGFAPAVNQIIETLPARRQTLFFSATVTRDVDRLAARLLDDPVAVDIGPRAVAADGVQHILVAVDRERKSSVLAKMLAEVPEGRALVFTRTKYGADKVGRHLRREGNNVAVLHGGKTQAVRTKTLDRFRRGQIRVLVATDVAARGIDVVDIAVVVNYDVPTDPEIYVHRVGRTARAGARGVALNLMALHECIAMRVVVKYMGRTLVRETVHGFEPALPPIQASVRRASRPVGRSLGDWRGGARRR